MLLRSERLQLARRWLALLQATHYRQHASDAARCGERTA
jgi:hypothetical protein